ncbi:MAG: hypothetical protein IT379_21400 [Deltaproteobacteria bacterium]|nr:hypothetical protein [Deltaproteobacteria bacterium]
MRVMMKVSIPTDAGNRTIREGVLPQTVMAFIESAKPEAAYFLPLDGKRTALFFFDLKEPSDIPVIAEPFFDKLGAEIEITPAMNAADMRSGVERVLKG